MHENSIVMMSIKPEYAAQILAGVKKYEFRRRLFRSDVRVVEIYSTSPVKRVVGNFTVKAIHKGSPVQIWNMCAAAGGINRDSFFRYFAGSNIAYAIEVELVEVYRSPRFISDYNMAPPQSFCYINHKGTLR